MEHNIRTFWNCAQRCQGFYSNNCIVAYMEMARAQKHYTSLKKIHIQKNLYTSREEKVGGPRLILTKNMKCNGRLEE